MSSMDSRSKWFALSIGMFGFAVMIAGTAGILADYTGYSGELLAMVMLGLVLTSSSAIMIWLHASGAVDLASKAWSRAVSN